MKAGDPTVGVFEDKEYLAGQFAAYEETVAAAEQATRESQEAGEVADAYVGTTILLAVALFFAGVESSFQLPPRPTAAADSGHRSGCRSGGPDRRPSRYLGWSIRRLGRGRSR